MGPRRYFKALFLLVLFSMFSSLKCRSLNVGTSSSLAGVSTLVEFEKVDLVFLQEVRISGEQIESLLRGFRAVSNIDEEDSTRLGVALAWRQELPVHDVSNLVSCRLQIASLGPVKLLNLYAPNGSSRKQERHLFFTEDVFPILQLNSHLSWIWSGDYNCLLQPVDIEEGKGFNSKKCPALNNIVASTNMVDAFRTLYPCNEEFLSSRMCCIKIR